jgi:hypothetical protein
MESKGIVIETTPNGDQILMGEAANQESLASDPRGPPTPPKAPACSIAAWLKCSPTPRSCPSRMARRRHPQWQLQKADASTRPSAKERDPYMRDQMDEDELKKIIKLYPHTREADLAAFELIDNKLCGDWQGSPKCPKKKPSSTRNTPPNSLTAPAPRRPSTRPSTARPSSTTCLPPTAATRKPTRPTTTPKTLASTSQTSSRSPITPASRAIVFKLDQGVPVYGIDRE